jgi:hypothetical protein
MKNIFIIFWLMFFTSAQAQTNSRYLEDITALYVILQKTPSYKDQIKKQVLIEYNNLFENLKSDSISNVADYKYFYNLAQLFFPIRDNHLGFYQTVDENNFKDRPAFEKYIATQAFKDFPKYNINIDSLKESLNNKPQESVEGIYYLDTLFSVGLFKVKDKEYIGVVLSSTITVWRNLNWEKGQIAIRLYEYLPNHFKAIYADPIMKRLILFPNEKFRDLSLINSHFYGFFYDKSYSKIKNRTDYTNLPKNIYDFNFRNIDSNIQYLHLKHFSAARDDIEKSNSFYDSIKNLITSPNLILDLRNNEGGAIKVSKKFLKLIRHYIKNGQVYVLVNNGTLSQGEIFTLQLKQLPNVKVLGQTTNGTLTYGSNYGKTEKLPSKAFQVYITDMKGDKRLIPYEVYGVNPDIILNNSKDWIEQAVELIRKK